MSNELIQQFQKNMKNGKTEQFRKYIINNNLTNEFIQQCFITTFRKAYQPRTEEYKAAVNLSNFALKLCEETFNLKFGTELANRFTKNIYETEQPSIRIFNTFMLMNPDIRVNSQYEANEMTKLFDLGAKKDNVIGTHIIGADIGDKLAREGISLTGHKFVANDYGNKNGSMKSRLEKNVTFFENDPIGFVTHIIKSRGYNNPTCKFNDIMLISIPKGELDRNEPNIIVQKNLGVGLEDCLNPEYIRGFARISVNDGKLEGIHSNPLFKNKTMNTYENEPQTLSVDDWKNKFETWYEQSNTTKLERLKNKVLKFLKKISRDNEDRDKDNNELYR